MACKFWYVSDRSSRGEFCECFKKEYLGRLSHDIFLKDSSNAINCFSMSCMYL